MPFDNPWSESGSGNDSDGSRSGYDAPPAFVSVSSAEDEQRQARENASSSTNRKGKETSSGDHRKKGLLDRDVRKDWSVCATAVREYDDKIIDSWRKSLDNVLIFAALFSAIITAFLIESYQWLIEDPAEQTNVLLSGLSQQLSNPNAMLPSGPLSVDDIPFSQDVTDIVINVLWFSSLVLSLNAVVLAILVKQWLSEYTWDMSSRPLSHRQTLSLRQLRFRGLYTWKVPHFVDYIPLLLLLSVYLFFTGLVIFTWTISLPLAIITIVLAGASVVSFAATSILPTFYPACVYHSSQSWLVYRIFSLFRSSLPDHSTHRPKGWPDVLVRYLNAPDGKGLDSEALRWINLALYSRDPSLLTSIWKCACTLDDPLSSRTLMILYSQSAEYTVGIASVFTERHAIALSDTIGNGWFMEGIRILLDNFPTDSSNFGLSRLQDDVSDRIRIISSFIQAHYSCSSGITERRRVLSAMNKLLTLVSATTVETKVNRVPINVRLALERETVDQICRVLPKVPRESVPYKDTPCRAEISGMFSNALKAARTSAVRSAPLPDSKFPALAGICLELFYCLPRKTFRKYHDQFEELLQNMAEFLGLPLHHNGGREVGDVASLWLDILIRHRTMEEDLNLYWDTYPVITAALRSLLIQMDVVLSRDQTFKSPLSQNVNLLCLEWGDPLMIRKACIQRISYDFEIHKEFTPDEMIWWTNTLEVLTRERIRDKLRALLFQDSSPSSSSEALHPTSVDERIHYAYLIALWSALIVDTVEDFRSREYEKPYLRDSLASAVRHIVKALQSLDGISDSSLPSFACARKWIWKAISEYTKIKYSTAITADAGSRGVVVKVPSTAKPLLLESVNSLLRYANDLLLRLTPDSESTTFSLVVGSLIFAGAVTGDPPDAETNKNVKMVFTTLHDVIKYRDQPTIQSTIASIHNVVMRRQPSDLPYKAMFTTLLLSLKQCGGTWSKSRIRRCDKILRKLSEGNEVQDDRPTRRSNVKGDLMNSMPIKTRNKTSTAPKVESNQSKVDQSLVVQDDADEDEGEWEDEDESVQDSDSS